MQTGDRGVQKIVDIINGSPQRGNKERRKKKAPELIQSRESSICSAFLFLPTRDIWSAYGPDDHHFLILVQCGRRAGLDTTKLDLLLTQYSCTPNSLATNNLLRQGTDRQRHAMHKPIYQSILIVYVET